MVLTAEIHQGRRTVMEYLLSPMQRVAMEAGRER
jgi:HlyD family secretion protein